MNKPLDLLIDDEISKAAFYQLLKESFYPLVLAASGERASAIRGDRVDRLVCQASGQPGFLPKEADCQKPRRGNRA